MRSAFLLPAAIAALAYAQDPADALPLDDLRDIDVPTYTTVDGLMTYDIPYATKTAIAAASEDASDTPLSVFPAATDAPINAAGEDDSSATTTDDAAAGATKRAVPFGDVIEKRTACAPQPTISNFFNVNVGSYSAFKADATISSVASAATDPAGYTNVFKNAAGANSAYAYLGYVVVNTGKYDVDYCAAKCTAKTGCLSFNIYFERDPTVEPGSGCDNPAAFANIKCSFWGAGLDSTTANNYGQWRANFQVGIAGSNAYNSGKLGGPVSGYDSPPQFFNTTVMNAPLHDCAGTWTYMGYKIYQSGPYDPRLCGAACDAQTAYDQANPPSDGSTTPLCGAFGSYLLTMTNSTKSYVQGQMCTLYTSNWDKQYAVNSVSYDDSIGAKYTYSYSYFYSKAANQPVCSSP